MSVGGLAAGTGIVLAGWRCHGDFTGFNPENRQPFPTVGFVHSGSFVLRDARGSALVDATGVGFFNAKAPYQTSHPAGPRDRGLFVVMGEAVAEDLFRTLGPATPRRSTPFFPFPFAPISGTACRRHWQSLSRLRQAADRDSLPWEEETLRVVGRVIAEAFPARSRHGPLRPRTRIRRREAVDATRLLLAADISRNHRLDDLARSVGFSPYHLCRVFKAETGQSIHGYRSRLRLRKAIARLGRDRTPLLPLALELGFASHSHFTESFRREFGVTPSQFARRGGAGRGDRSG